MKLYEIAEEYRKLANAIEEGLIPEEAVDDMLEAVQIPFEEKVDSLASWVKELTADSEGIGAEIKRLQERKKSKDATIERVKSAILKAMETTGVNKVETPRNKVTTRKSSHVEVVDINALMESDYAEEYLRYSEPSVNKNAVSKALKEGKVVAGCVLEETVSVSLK